VSYQVRKLQRQMETSTEVRQLIAKTEKALDVAREVKSKRVIECLEG
jgi:hypothetical protein